MKFQITSHAIDRWRERVEPGATYAAASDALEAALAGATSIGRTPRGEVVYSLQHPAQPVAFVRHRERMGHRYREGDRPVVVTVLEGDRWHEAPDPAQEILEAYDDLVAKRAPPPEWTPRKPVDVAAVHKRTMALAEKPTTTLSACERDQIFGRLLAVVESERRRVACYEAEVSGAGEAFEVLGRVTMRLREGDAAAALAMCEAFLGARSPRA